MLPLATSVRLFASISVASLASSVIAPADAVMETSPVVSIVLTCTLLVPKT